jgi:AraC-like DNA-binding protein
MKLREKGVLPESNVYFHIPKENDRKVLLTPNSCGFYTCDDNYKVSRERYCGYLLHDDTYFAKKGDYGSYLCLFIIDGKGYVYQNDHKIILSKNDAFLLDCYHPHIYGTLSKSKMEMIWVHFNGPMIRDCFKQITNGTNCAVLKNLSAIRSKNIFNNLYNIYERIDKKKDVNDILNNKYLVTVITEFLLGNSLTPESKNNSWDDLLTYISENIQKPLKPRDLAKRMALSLYHFTRMFKKKIGYSPYHYVLHTKMNTANHLLQYSSLSIKEISYLCGFSSEASFCNAFKNFAGVWPSVYRNKIN